MNSIQNGLSSLLQSYRQIQARTAESMKVLGSGKRITHPKIDPTAWRDIAWHNDQAAKIQSYSENLTTAGISTRVALASMDATGKNFDLLAEKLASASAASPGSADRQTHLNEFNRIHAQMGDLATPPDPGAQRLLGDPASVDRAGDITIRGGENFTFTLRHQPIYLGEGGLEVSAITDPENATTEDIEAAVAQLETAREELFLKREGLAIDASAIARGVEFNDVAKDQNLEQADRLGTPDLNREAALMQAMSVRSSIAIHGLTSLNETHMQAVQLLP